MSFDLKRLDKYISGQPLLIALVLNLVLFALTYWFLTPRFMTNDDVGMMLEVAGVSRTNVPSAYMIHSHYFIGLILKTLYTSAPSAPWYGLYLVTTVFSSLTTFCYLALRANPRFLTILVYLTIFIFLGIELLLNLQFTIAASLIGLAGMSFFIFSDSAEGEKRAGKNKRHFALGFLFLMLCVAIRWKAFLMVCALSVPLYAIHLIKSKRRDLIAKSLFLGLSLAFCFGLNITNRLIWAQDASWKSFYDFNKARSKLSGNNPLDYLDKEKLAQVLKEVSWSRNDYDMFKTFYFLDNDTYNTENLQRLLNAAPTFKEISFKKSLNSLKRILHDPFVLFSFFIFLFGVIGFARGPNPLFTSLCGLILFPSLVFFLIYYFRPPPQRVYYSMAIFVAFIPLMISKPKVLQKRLLSTNKIVSILLLAFTIISIGSRSNYYDNQSQRNDYNRDALHSLIELTDYRYRDNLFVTWGSSFFWEYIPPFENISYLNNFNAFHIGCSQLTPSNQNLLEHFNVDNLIQDMLEREDILLICNGKKKKRLIRTYYLEHFNEYVELENLFGTKKFDLIKINHLGN